MIESFHFLRPLFLTLIPVIVGLWWWHRRQQDESAIETRFAPHLAEALTVGQRDQRIITPTDTLTLILLICAIALAGPSWRQQPAPWFSEEAPVVIALEVSDSMRSNDVLPNRLERSRIKILELIKERTGARTALIAYSSSAHLVVPLTKDVDVIRHFLESLDPLMMPQATSASGNRLDQALALARSLFPEGAQPGTLVVVTDGIEPTDSAAIQNHQSLPGAPPLMFYVAGTEAGGVALLPDGSMARNASGGPVDTRVDLSQLGSITRSVDIPVIRLTTDVSDIGQLVRKIRSSAAAAEDPDNLWIDEAWWLLWPVALLMLIHFRQGWTSS